jgi:hypothetical protein
VLELYAIEIQMYSDLKEFKKQKVGQLGDPPRRQASKLTVVGDLQCRYASQKCHPAPADHGRDTRMRWQDVDDGE